MSKNFNNCRKTTRLQNWDYRWKGLYFVTVNTKFGENYFGEISNGEVILNDIGKEVEKQWLRTPSFRPDMNLVLDEFVVMPNHFHGIIGIGANKFNSFVPSLLGPEDVPDSIHTSEIKKIHLEDLLKIQNQNIFGPQSKNLGSIMRGFKSAVTSSCRINNRLFNWHTKFFEERIKDEIVLNKVRKYIKNNPKNWHKDRFRKK